MHGRNTLLVRSPPPDLTLAEILSHFRTDEKARQYLEAVRWLDDRCCPHCGNADQTRIHAIKANKPKKIRPGLYECGECRDQFTVTVGTVFHGSKVPLRKWLAAFYLLCSSKKGFSALQLQRALELGSYRTAWFMFHRIRYALGDDVVEGKLSGTLEAAESYLGGEQRHTKRGRSSKDSHKAPVVAPIERGGKAQSEHMRRVTSANVGSMLTQHGEPMALLATDEFSIYNRSGERSAGHGRGQRGLGEYTFDLRYNTRHLTRGERTVAGIGHVGGKRVMWKRPAQV